VIGPDATPLFILPGDALGSFVSFEVFVRPVIRRMLGVEPITRPVVRAVCVGTVVSEPGLRHYVRAILDVEHGRYVVRPAPVDGARGLPGVDTTNALLVVPESTTHVADGDSVEVMVLERRHA
jgi:molybdopterin molybdotransferase